MKRTRFTRLLLIAALLGFSKASNAQSIVGSWKKTDETVTGSNGKTKSTFQMIVKSMPCFADIIYTFSAGGKMNEKAGDCSMVLQNQVDAEAKSTHWKLVGNKVIMDLSDKTSPVIHAEYIVEFAGPNEMTWTFIYAENPGVPNITKAKQMKTTYKRSAG